MKKIFLVLIISLFSISICKAWEGETWTNSVNDIGNGVIEKVEFVNQASLGESIQIKFTNTSTWWRAYRTQFNSDSEYNRLLSMVLMLKSTKTPVSLLWRVSDNPINQTPTFKGFEF